VRLRSLKLSRHLAVHIMFTGKPGSCLVLPLGESLMFVYRLRTVALAVTASLGLAACAYDDGGYGYGGMGYASDYYGEGYGGYGGYYDNYGGGYGYAGYPSYYGWYDDFYYPGVGFYIYDRGGHRHRWNDHQRHYWEGRRGHGSDHNARWDGYHRGNDGNWHGNAVRSLSGPARSVRSPAAQSPSRPSRSVERSAPPSGQDYRSSRRGGDGGNWSRPSSSRSYGRGDRRH